MKKFIEIILVFLALVVVLVIGSYAINFYSHDVSDSPEQWGQLGDFVGGILNPFLGFVTVLILVRTMRLQSKQLKSSRKELALTRVELKQAAEAATKQANQFEREAKLREYLVLIEKLAVRINRNFNDNKLDGERSLHYFINNHRVLQRRDYLIAVKDDYCTEGSKTQAVIKWVASDLRRLSVLIEKYEEISNNAQDSDVSPMPKFYQVEFKELVEALYVNGMMDSDIKDFYAPSM